MASYYLINQYDTDMVLSIGSLIVAFYCNNN